MIQNQGLIRYGIISMRTNLITDTVLAADRFSRTNLKIIYNTQYEIAIIQPQNFSLYIHTVKSKITAFREKEPIRGKPCIISGINLFYFVLYTCLNVFKSLHHIQGITFLRSAHQLTYIL